MSWVKCPREECRHVWQTHSSLVMVTCPSCYRKCNVKQNIVEPPGLMEHFNVNADGVRILDRGLKTEHSPNGMIVDVYFKQGKALCEYDDSSDCKHVQFALSLPVVQDIFKKKGWKLNEV